MECCTLPIAASTLACAIAGQIPEEGRLVLLAALFTQLGDNLALIAAQRAACDK